MINSDLDPERIEDSGDLGIYEDLGAGSDPSDTNEEVSVEQISKTRDKQQREYRSQHHGTLLSHLVNTSIKSDFPHQKATTELSNDPALFVRSLTTPSSQSKPSNMKSSQNQTTRQSVHADDVRAIDKQLLTLGKDLVHIQKKCLGNDTRSATPFINLRDIQMADASSPSTPYGYFYLQQQRPTPMIPLKAWKGYSGNVYFDPIKINRVKSATNAIDTVNQYQSMNINHALRKRRYQTAKPDLNRSTHCDFLRRPAVKMDRRFVMSHKNKNVQEDLEWLRNSNTLGSLKIEKGCGDKAKNVKLSQKSLCKGSVSHKLNQERNKTASSAVKFAVSGDPVKQVKPINPLLKVATQYSQSTSRLLNNTPDVDSHVTSAKLPYMEHIKASLVKFQRGEKEPPKQGSKLKIVQNNEIPSYVRLARVVPQYSTAKS